MVTGAPEIHGYGDFAVMGRGGFATVYRARQLAFDREVAVKVIDRPAAGDRAVQMFTRECQAIGSLSWHPHVVTVYDAGETQDGRLYLAMELVPGGSVGDAMGSGPLAVDVAIRYGTQIADAVAAAHDVGVLHRDLKPANVLIDRRDAAQLADFGIARVMGAEASTTGVVSGTIAYLAPELLQGGSASVASDVYGIGLTVAAMVMGRSPFGAVTDETPFAAFTRVTADPLPDLRPFGLPDAVAGLVARCASKAPDRRPATAAEVRDALEVGAREANLDAPLPAHEPTVVVQEPSPRPPVVSTPPPPTSPTVEPPPPSSPSAEAPATSAPSVSIAGAAMPGSASSEWRTSEEHDGAVITSETRSARWTWIVAAVVVLALLGMAAAIGAVVVLRGGDGEECSSHARPSLAEQESGTTSLPQANNSLPPNPTTGTTPSTTDEPLIPTGSTTPSGEPC